MLPAISPDGREGRVRVDARRRANWDIWVVNRDGSDLQNLTPNTPSLNRERADLVADRHADRLHV